MTEESLKLAGELLGLEIKEKTIYLTSDGKRYDSADEAQWYQNEIIKNKIRSKAEEIRSAISKIDISGEIIKYWMSFDNGRGNTNILKGCFFKFKNYYNPEDFKRGQDLVKKEKWDDVEDFLLEAESAAINKIQEKNFPFSEIGETYEENGFVTIFDSESLEFKTFNLAEELGRIEKKKKEREEYENIIKMWKEGKCSLPANVKFIY
jgi:hypothetical protein